ncbi:MAG: hypothetical protein GW772_09805 [Flavobacteriia bacterium]|nr:hypothetical protein [Flavobacteriia bacterium]OIP46516.1 MAG: hypothetical protein AUK46_08215 [Flavobacteriaceae bacterium CG2_30_31_66]PIV96459.1 MAG: hypothetical protein COW43_08060 [Flavobacteriaceae bacterium CG17_big_fil_post_rev_8_21_14_2_50_31_13]PIX14547.1 MAG: hypothetical protein COZ74_02625 [Flavobacteriaceae bacterium CG_4_8_14_3_um_filter_31_8]PIY15080.1 MAG: hypothetical protein COZ16_05715 [Flavobacteriaceae bacterium CG_4_10_14_3_um_filter_31_253]PIZ09720.1 MAG: hypotheti
MKIKIIFTILCFLSISKIKPQESNSLLNSRIVISVIMPENEEKISNDNFAKIKSKIKQIISKNDVAATDYYADFLIYPTIEIYDEENLDAGLQPITIISGDFTLFVKQFSTNNQFGSITVKFKGSGKDKSEAIRNGILKINSNNENFQTFLKNVKSKIIGYYQNNCSLIITEADKLNASNLYEKAIIQLISIPAGVTKCDSEINRKLVQYYKNYSNTVCEKSMIIANGYYSEQNYSKTLEVLRTINPESKCKEASLSLMRKIESKIDANEKRLFDLTIKTYNDEIELEKMRINSIKEIALEYYKNQPETKIHVIK